MPRAGPPSEIASLIHELTGAIVELTMSQELLTPEDVLRQFHELRGQVLQVIDEGEQVAKKFPAVAAAEKADFEDARHSVSESRLSFVVLGGEGAGKSTLICGLIGADVAPVAHDQPGTVAPLYLEYGNSGEPTFTIEFFSKENKKPLVCDKETYSQYILQKTNEGNQKRVERATVKLNNRLLEHGLVLVDMPGTGGVSHELRAEAQNFIRYNAAAVIGVAMMRTYGPLVDVAREFSTRDRPIVFQAIVSN